MKLDEELRLIMIMLRLSLQIFCAFNLIQIIKRGFIYGNHK